MCNIVLCLNGSSQDEQSLPHPQGDVACWHCKGSNGGVGKEATSVFWQYKVAGNF